MTAPSRWPCPACGYQTIEARPPGPPGTGVECPVCGWIDAPERDAEGGRGDRRSNGVTLREAQRNVLATGACTEWCSSNRRSPLLGEERASDWRTLDALAAEERVALLAEIEAAFDGVSREGGVSLHETEAIDLYKGDEARQAARRLDTESRWQDVPHADLAEVCGVGGISFFNPIGWRYYLPAYMTWWLSGGETSKSFAAECLLYSLTLSKELAAYQLGRYTSLGPRQVAVVTRFLRFVERFAEYESSQQDARLALAKYWAERSQ